MYCANNASRLVGRDFSTPDFESIHNAERMIAYANSKGITLWIGAWWSAKDLDQQAGPEKIRRWWRYTIQRLAAYNVMWNIAGEYNMYNYGGLGLQFWKDTGALIRKEDPYRHALGVHNTPPGWAAGEMGDSAQWSTSSKLNDEPWLDFHNSQTGHAKWRSELVPGIISSDYALTPHRPTLITEPWYEFAEGSAPAMDVRFAAWSAFLSGAAGHTYGGGDQWWARVPKLSTPPAGAANRSRPASDGGGWPRPDPGQDTLDFPGAASVGYMAKLLRGLEWWKLEPHPELVREYAQSLAAAIPGQEYLVYARYGGKFKLDLSAFPATDRFKVTWIDLVNSKESRSAFINGGSLVGCQAPEDFPSNRDYKDWLVHVVKVP
jgi:hypothetical protein